MEENKLWVFKSVSDEDRSYKSIGSYNDELTTKYVYDNFVGNHQQVKAGDKVIIIDKKEILGFAKIEKIQNELSEKKRSKCPTCGTTNFGSRKNKTPLYRCNKGHEFDHIIEETVSAKIFTASYGRYFVKPSTSLSISALRPYYTNNYNRNMSIQLLSKQFFDNYFKHIPQILNGSPSLLSTDADDSDTSSNDYNIGLSDEREIINRQIRERREQKKFREAIIKRYGKKCMITGCQLLDILEAAHINPYRGENDNNPLNGLLLRADIHTLFDLNLIGIEPVSLKISVHSSALQNGYHEFHNCYLQSCTDVKKPSLSALKFRWEQFKSKQSFN